MQASSGQRLRVAVIGCGYLGRFHAEKYAAMPHAELVGVVDPDVARARAVGEALGVAAYPDAEAVLPHVDAASIVVPTSLHHAVAKTVLRRGVHVLVEKPITERLPQATDLIRLAARKGCILQVGHLERFNAVWEVAGPALEAPRFIEVHRIGPFQDRGTDVDVVLDLMIHDIDILLKYVGSPVRHVDSVGVPVLSSNADIANVRLHFTNGAVANLTASRVSLARKRKIRFFQKDLYVSVDYDARKVEVVRRLPGEGSGTPGIHAEERTVPEADALQAELEGFVKSVQSRRPPEVGGAEGRAALAVALRIRRRMRSS